MLKITIHDSAQELRLVLEGRLAGAWVCELRQCWQTAASTTQFRDTVVDLREVDFIDAEGQTLLDDMHRSGVRLEAEGPLIRHMVEEIAAAGCGTVEGKSTQRLDAFLSHHPPRRNPRAV